MLRAGVWMLRKSVQKCFAKASENASHSDGVQRGRFQRSATIMRFGVIAGAIVRAQATQRTREEEAILDLWRVSPRWLRWDWVKEGCQVSGEGSV